MVYIPQCIYNDVTARLSVICYCIQVGYEQQFHSLCYEGSACIADFADLLRLGVDPNIHDQVCYSK